MTLSLAHYWELLAAYLRPQRRFVLALAFMLVGGIGLQLLVPQVLRAFIDAAQSGRPDQDLVNLALVFLLITGVQYLLRLGTTYTSERISWTATNALRLDLAQHILRLDLAFHTTHTPGELIERVDGDCSALATFFSQLALQAVSNLLLLGGVLVVLSFEDWRVGIAFTLFALITLAILRSMRDIATPHLRAERAASAELFGFLEERLAGTEDIRANGGNRYTLGRLLTAMQRVSKTNLTAELKIATLRTTIIFFFSTGGILALVLGAYLFWAGAITVGTVYLIFAYVQMMARPIERLALEAQHLQQASASILRVTELYHTQPTILDGTNADTRPSAQREPGPPSVEFCNVSFGYETTEPTIDDGAAEPGTDGGTAEPVIEQKNKGTTEQKSQKSVPSPFDGARSSGHLATSHQPPATSHRPVLNGISFVLAPGEVLGLLGRTGSGKTTITRLLLRLYDTTAGDILINGQSIRDMPLAELRRTIGVVTQDVQLFHASVRDNLTLFHHDVADATIIYALEELGLSAWFASLPQGLDTVLVSGGGGLSAGESQLLAFARVLLRDPKLVILDEASSRLDPVTERLIERAIDRLLAGRTAIIVAHRLATVQRAHTILMLRGGQIAEYGLRRELAEEPSSIFAQLLRGGLDAALADQEERA
jgi:ABC-type multidrug transport system fused ATPase/permease subunit